jgi:hypothetical protein
MKTRTTLLICFTASLTLWQNTCVAGSNPFLAYSMREAEHRLKMSQNHDIEVTSLGGITRLVGAVYDSSRDDLIIVGQVVPDEMSVNLDDLVVAIRSRFLHDKFPEVSIEKNNSDTSSETQTVRYEGGIEHTHLGKCFFEADVILKKISLGLLPTEIWGVHSYFDMAVEQQKKNPQERMLSTRFWFNPVKRYSVAVRSGVIALDDLRIHIQAQLESASSATKSFPDQTDIRNKVADCFAQLLSDTYGDLCTAYPEIDALKSLMDFIAIAKGIDNLNIKPTIAYWINEYSEEHVDTLSDCPLLKRESKISDGDETFIFQVRGGVAARAAMSRLIEEGDITAIRDLVCMSRPDKPALTWRVPIDGWTVPGYETTDYEIIYDEEYATLSEDGTRGCTIDEQLFVKDRTNTVFPVIGTQMPNTRGRFYSDSDFEVAQCISTPKYSSKVGGVMLQGTARIEGARNARVDLNSGNFSLVVDGQNARLDPKTFRKFITALWAVYYSNQDPGISIDPIAPGVDKHMVRYIGKVINTDLGRVMREADYLMKAWSVGTARPDIYGFRNPDDISGGRGYAYLGASRFWFVPDEMQFKHANNILLFDKGRMTVQTEYLLDNDTGMKADPANEQFAQFLTNNYNELAEQYPVLKELFDYAKMVSLGKYLKQNGVPLHWFLMANKDLVLTEDSPGTVEALAKGSDYFKNLLIEGGVDLGVHGNYVYDSDAVEAILEAANKCGIPSESTAPASYTVREVPSIRRTFSFDLGEQSYTVVPQHSLTSGKDRRGIRYQTDMALRDAGFRLTEDSWKALRSEIIYREFAKGWNHLTQDMNREQLESQGESLYRQAWEKADKKVAETIEKLKGLIDRKFTSRDEFVQALEAVAGREKAMDMKPLALKHAYYVCNLELVRYYNPNQGNYGEFGKDWQLLIPYRIRPADNEKREFLNALIPKQMVLQNLITGEQEVLTFSTDRYSIAGYVPDKLNSSQIVGLFIMSDTSYRLADKLGNEFCFDQVGRLTDMCFSQDHHIHLEYLHSFTKAFEQAPYKIEPVGSEKIKFLNTLVPKMMKLEDLVNDYSEVLVFSDKGMIAGYVPRNEERSRFKILALMSDASFRLLDIKGNEIKLRPDGKFESLAISPDNSMVKSISTGPYKVRFEYTIDESGRVLIASSRLLEGAEGKPVYTVCYEYDDRGRLCGAKGMETKTAQLVRKEGEVLLAKR